MFKQKIYISVRPGIDRELLHGEFLTLLGNLRRKGQISGNLEMPFFTDTGLVSYQTSLEANSLSQKYFDEYTRRYIQQVETICDDHLKTEVQGKAIPGTPIACKCKHSSFYILFTHFLNEAGFIECGDCANIVPLYKLVSLSAEDRIQMHRWEEQYKACDELQMASAFGEKWATRQMSDLRSGLSKEGLEVCKLVFEKTGVPMYYYLYSYSTTSFKKDKKRLCPGCDGVWVLSEPLHTFYNFRCDKCRLLSNFANSLK